MAVEPITPREVADLKLSTLPEKVVDCWNKMIAEKYSSGSAIVRQDDIVLALCRVMRCKRERVFKSGWLDIEAMYRSRGWRVRYDKPRLQRVRRGLLRVPREGGLMEKMTLLGHVSQTGQAAGRKIDSKALEERLAQIAAQG